MRPTLPHPAPDERGFILVGVVMFMLALTILGLSLFALSSYEGQFFAASAAREQSLQDSESGMELIKVLLAAKGSKLEDANRAVGQMGVTSAMAYQWRSDVPTDTTSVGPVNWDTTMVQDPSHVGVVIVVTAKSGGVERTLQARFVPGVTENPYQHLLAAGTGVSVNTNNSPSPSVLEITGRVWQPVASAADTAWTDHVDWTSGLPIERGKPPAPLVHDFVQQHWPAAEDPNGDFDHDDNGYNLQLSGVKDVPTFFRSPTSPIKAGEGDDYQHTAYSFYVGDELDITVKGIAVWVIPKGACFKKRVTVDADASPSTLVIVAEPSMDDPADGNRGLWFDGGLRIKDGVSVYLVSQGDISVLHDDHDSQGRSNTASTISIVAGGRIEIGGPESSDAFTLGYDPSLMDLVSDQLLAQGALPPVIGGTGANFAVVRQTWLETTPR